jgi:hypothetical protein
VLRRIKRYEKKQRNKGGQSERAKIKRETRERSGIKEAVQHKRKSDREKRRGRRDWAIEVNE